jgi:transposase-like protein
MGEGSIEASAGTTLFVGKAWFDPIEAGIRERVRGFIEELIEQELRTALGADAISGVRESRRATRMERASAISPAAWALWRSASRARLREVGGRTRQVEALIAAACLAGTNKHRVKRTLGALFKGAAGRGVVSRTWRKLKGDWEAWWRRDLAGEDVVRLILDGTVVRVRLDRKATSFSLLVVPGVRRDGQKVMLAAKNMGGESEAAWRAVLDDLIARGLRTPDFLIVDGAAGLERALAAFWPDVPAQRCGIPSGSRLEWGARSTSTGTCWRTRQTSCMRRFRRTTRP